VARQDGKNVIISKGLSNGDRLITSALDYPVDGMKLALIGDKSQETDEQVDDAESATQIAANDSGSGE